MGNRPALPRQEITRRQAGPTSAWQRPERLHMVKRSAQRRPGVKWGLEAESAEEEQELKERELRDGLSERSWHYFACDVASGARRNL